MTVCVIDRRFNKTCGKMSLSYARLCGTAVAGGVVMCSSTPSTATQDTSTAVSSTTPIPQHQNVVVIGGGIMGAATAYSLSTRPNTTVTLIDASHPFKSSWGETRIARLSQPGGVLKVQMMQRARELWTRLTDDVGKLLLKQTGILDIANPDNVAVAQVIAA
jgi:hypothetical protein